MLLHNAHAAVYSREKPDDFIYIAGTDDIMADKIGCVSDVMSVVAFVSPCWTSP